MRISFLALAAALALSSPAFAQGAGHGQMIDRLQQADANNDGTVSRSEFVNFRAQQFSRFDRNGDGAISDDDMPRLMARRAGNGMSPEQMIAQFDTNNDGRVSQSEFVNGPTPAFDAVDANGDDLATDAEFNAARAARGN